MQHERFRKHGKDVIDWIADYMTNGYDGPVFPKTQPGEVLAQLPMEPPQEAEPGEQVFADFESLILPHTTHWNDPRFYAYFPANHSGPGILGDLLSAGLGVNGMSWVTSPAATELEMRMIDWLGHMLKLPWRGCIQDTASTATFCALLAAREQVADVNQSGFYQQQPMTVYASKHAHSSMQKAVWMAGFGERYLRLVPGNDDDFAMDAAVLAQMVAEDIAAGFRPTFVMSTVGTTSSTAIDPVHAVADICEANNMWHHVDAALAGTAAILPEMRWILDGTERADSFCFNPHKWMFTNFDCSVLLVKSPDALKKAMAINPEYLKAGHDAVVENFRDWGPQLGRRFRALKLWYVIRCFGVAGLQDKIRAHLNMTRWFADQVRAEPRTHLLTEPKINTVCFHLDDDAATKALMKAVNDSGEAYLSHTVLRDRYVIRVSFGQIHQSQQHVATLWGLISRLLP
ncbi:pyridoxal phosphate-dependent decarboxylase family protein [Acanthopleuribacter pedis]|uniref:Aspartate aminotransferase family protein n=1 Tax=Acanthopleuribacter pedis TaxID=442870 RepID=A0A8J7U2W0_9BACT|nr:pyridoxal-dependent decarboxylase [Acanthopleuribacter pedis]MBO1318149.1 aspartate aminotransferase family protein [Acanthopleuribacter pedis]